MPRLIAKPYPSVTVKEKQNVALPCKAAGFPPPVITWYKDGQVIEDEKRQFKERNLEIKEIQFEDRGIYTCTAENLLGRVQSSVNLTVKVPTKFVAKPKSSVTAYKNWDTDLKCDIFGYPFPVITWTRSLKQLPVNRHVIDGNKLTIKNTTEDDGGAYLCQGANELDSVVAVTWVFVKDAVNPSIVASPPSEIQVPNVGDSVKLNCSARGSPLPKIKWFKDGRRVNATEMHDGKDSIKSEFIIHHFEPKDDGTYTCLFHNDKNRTAEANSTVSLVNCGDPGSASNGQKLGSRHWTGQTTRKCLPSGSWSGIQPSCHKSCPSLESLRNGHNHGQQYWEGKRVSFTCNPGYSLKGSSERRCQTSGAWTGVQPSCIGKKGSQAKVPGLSCKNIQDSGDLETRGTYWIRPPGLDVSFQGYCDMSAIGKWTRVTQSSIESTFKGGATVTYSEENNGLVISGHMTSHGCGSGGDPGVLTYIKGYWTKIKYKQEFRGTASCWSIFGNDYYGRNSVNNEPPGLHPFDAAQGDSITNQHYMGGGNSHKFDGRTRKCDNLVTNFWRFANANVRYATVTLRRQLTAEKAGIFTGTSCGKPTFKIKDIYIYF
ncbi:hypothetical protein ACROYT_G031985 [Oculina patagonica]